MQFRDLELSFGEAPLLDNISFSINQNDRIAIVGRNGVGKSTLLKLINGEIEADGGHIERKNLTVGKLIQEVPRDLSGTIFDLVASAHQSDAQWQETHPIERVISQLGLEGSTPLAELSGGQMRRALLAQALVNEPDILLLDEPTNHLDLESILWLENFLQRYPKAVVFITHDRSFLQQVANRIFELDCGQLLTWDGDYQGFLKHKEQQLAAQETANQLFDKKLAQEEVWIRQGIKARRTRNEGRVRALKKMRQERQQRRQQTGTANFAAQATERSGKQVFTLEHISEDYQGERIIDDFSTVVMRGDKIGIIGPNGCGKTTLLSIILGKLQPKSGQVHLGTKLNIAYFDQHRQALNPDLSVLDNLAEGADSVEINGKHQHVISYLQEFLFTPSKARGLVKTLSGGERNRLLLAKLFAQNANVLVLDEPTNDLDMETLELLEEYLVNFTGTILLVSHDRSFLNNVVTSTIVFEGKGKIQEYVGGYDDWQRQKKPSDTASKKPTKSQKPAAEKPKAKKLSYKYQRELDQLPDKIEALEANITELQNQMNAPEFYQQEHQVIQQAGEQLNQWQAELEQLYQRWEELS